MNDPIAGLLSDQRPAVDLRPEWILLGLVVGFLVAFVWPSKWKEGPDGR